MFGDVAPCLALKGSVPQFAQTTQGVHSRTYSTLFFLEIYLAAARVYRVYFLLALGGQERPEDLASEFRERLVYEQVIATQLQPPRHHTIANTVLA